MINILSYVGMNMQSEVCLWCLVGIVRTIFDATLFKVNANLKQVWQMTMPEELTMPVQRVLRTMVSGVMLVQCFTVYVYLASYIVLLYPVFLEERPTLVLPWLLLAAIRKLLCELTSLALGLGTCVLLGPARPPCIRFVVVKFTLIMPAFYMWMLVFSYYDALKVATAFKTFPAVLPPNDNDYGLELAVRRRRTKSLLGEEQLRKKLVAHYYGESTSSVTKETFLRPALEMTSKTGHSTDSSIGEESPETDVMKPLTMSSTGWSDIGAYEDWFGSEVMIPRDTDRILEQIVLMSLRIGAYLKKEGIDCIVDSQKLNSAVPTSWHQRDNIDCAAMNADDTETPPQIGSSKGNMASYLREYPQIFMKKLSLDNPQTERTIATLKTVHSQSETDESNKNKVKHITPGPSHNTIFVEVEKVPSKKKLTISDINNTAEDKNVQQTWPSQKKQSPKGEGKKVKQRLKKQCDLDRQSKKNTSKVTNKLQSEQECKHFMEDRKESLNTNISTIIKNSDSIDSQLLKDNNINECTHSKTLDDNNNKQFRDFAISNANSKAFADYESLAQYSKIPSSDNNKNASESTIFKADTNEEFTLSQINGGKELTISRLSNEDYKDVTSSSTEDKFNYKDRKISFEDSSSQGTSSLSNNDKGISISHDLMMIHNLSNRYESTRVNIFDKDSNTSLTCNIVLDLGKNKELVNQQQEFTHRQFPEDDKKVELSLHIISDDDDSINSLDVKITNEDIKSESTDLKIMNEDEKNEFIEKERSNKDFNEELTHSKELNDGKNNESIVNEISNSIEANNKDSTDGKLFEEVSKETKGETSTKTTLCINSNENINA